MKCRRCQSSLKYSPREAFSPIGSRPCVSPKRSSTVGSFARWVFSISRRKRSSSSVRTRRALLGLPAVPLDEAPTILFHEDALSGLLRLILHRLAGKFGDPSCGTWALACILCIIGQSSTGNSSFWFVLSKHRETVKSWSKEIDPSSDNRRRYLP